MTVHQPRRRQASTDWDPAWGNRVYGPDQVQWKALKARYWASRWTLFRRCLLCRSGRDLQLNHLTYWPTKIKVGWVPLLFLVPLCPRCHKIETKLTRWFRRHRINFGEHVIATFGLYGATRSVVVGGLWYLLVLWPGVPAPWNVNWPW